MKNIVVVIVEAQVSNDLNFARVLSAYDRAIKSFGKIHADNIVYHFAGNGFRSIRLRDIPRERWGSFISRVNNELSGKVF